MNNSITAIGKAFTPNIRPTNILTRPHAAGKFIGTYRFPRKDGSTLHTDVYSSLLGPSENVHGKIERLGMITFVDPTSGMELFEKSVFQSGEEHCAGLACNPFDRDNCRKILDIVGDFDFPMIDNAVDQIVSAFRQLGRKLTK